MKTFFCEKCHKPLRLPFNIKGSLDINIKCPDGHNNHIKIEKQE